MRPFSMARPPRDSLGSLKVAGELQGGETRAVHAYPKRACPQ